MVVLGLFFFLQGFVTFYIMFIGPGHGGLALCGQTTARTCWEDVGLGVAVMLQMLAGGATSFIAGIHYRQTLKLTIWEVVQIAFLVVLLFDLFTLPQVIFPYVLNGAGILIFTIGAACMFGLVTSAFIYRLSNKRNGVGTLGLGPSSAASARHRNVYGLVFALAFVLALSVYAWPAFAYAGFHSCPAITGELSFTISGYWQLVGPPLFSEEQILVPPGSITYVTYIYTGYGDNNLTAWFSQENLSSQPWSPERVDPFTGWTDRTAMNSSGVTETFQNITYQGTHIAMLLYRFDITKSAGPATYMLAGVCETGLLLTVGYLPYGGPLPYGETQPVGLFFNFATSLAGALPIAVALHFYYWRAEVREAKSEASVPP